ncbi:MAG: hypothetical protein AAFQ92_25815 [Bacteroidota bacterium]
MRALKCQCANNMIVTYQTFLNLPEWYPLTCLLPMLRSQNLFADNAVAWRVSLRDAGIRPR